MKRLLTLIIAFSCISNLSFAQPTWSEDIACIVYSHCTGCHTATGIAPFNLESYQDAFSNRYAIQSSVSSKFMPPWPPAQDFNPMAHANSLSQEEIDLVNAWVNAGAPEGNPMDAPDVPVFDATEEISEPDYVVTLPSYTIPSNSNGDMYKCFVIPTNLGTDKQITGIEIIPGNRNIVHHVLMFQDVSNTPLVLDQNDPDIGYTCFGDPGSQSAKLIAGWVPGSRVRYLPSGMAVPLPDGANIVVQIHYPEGSDGETDQTKINLEFSDAPNLRQVYNEPILNHYQNINQPLIVPANQVRSFEESYTLPIGVTGVSVAPHAHLICTSMRLEADLPSGETMPLIDIPHWDFNWQGFYDLKLPAILPAGTVLRGYATYDNTINNPNNPNNPPQTVTVGESTTDEMMVFYVSFAIYNPGDENLVFDDNDHSEHHDDCTTSFNSGLYDIEDKISVNFLPNPVVDGTLHIQMESGYQGDYSAELLDMTGKSLKTFNCQGDCTLSLGQDLTNGIYFCRILENGKAITKAQKIVLMR